MNARPIGTRSTASVLWLMILLVFLPIAAAHGLACYAEGPSPAAQVAESR